MSDEGDNAATTNGVETSEEEQKPQKKAAKHDSGAADLEKVTDYAEEQEISSQDINRAMSLIGDKRSKEIAERVARQNELAKVTIKKEDVELIVQELEIPRSQAELKLREYHGNVVEALIALTN
jgi:NACalpha-BTF3-like transcription factor